MIPQADGKILIGGGFTSIGGQAAVRVARLNTNGTLDADFNPGGAGAGNDVRSVMLQPDGKILIGGGFTTVNGTDRNRIARLNTNGTLDADFNPGGAGADNDVRSVMLQPDGKILIGGGFTTVNGTSRNRIARLNTDPGVPGAPGNVMATISGTAATIAFDPAEPNGSTVTGYTVTGSPGGSTCALAAPFPSPLQCSITGLTPGTTYTFSVTATNSVGPGTAALSAPVSLPLPTPSAQAPVAGCVTSGGRLPRKGTRQLMKPSCVTSAGRTVGARLQVPPKYNRHFQLYCQVSKKRTAKTRATGYGDGTHYCRQGALRIRTHGHRTRVNITWSAPATGDHTACTLTRTYRT